jgi:UDP-N-acetylglucosamine 2-epimerase (non-hydrolysing)
MKNKLPLLICFGTRPEWLKVKPIIETMAPGTYRLLFTGQHMNLVDIPVDYTILIDEASNRLDSILSACLLQFPPADDIGAVLVQGDTASAFGCALAAYHRSLPIYYLEAGLRSYNLEHPFPEEGYRQMISRISTINFAPTITSSTNLSTELVQGKTYIVGNTVLDNLLRYEQGEYGNTILVTLHRRENHSLLAEWFTAIENLATEFTQYNFVLPMHPSPDVQKHKHLLKNVSVVSPMSHDETMQLLRNCRLVISDSGGLQEEGAFFNKKVIVCRKTTERPEGLDTGHLYLCPLPNELDGIFRTLERTPHINVPCPYGDGNSSHRILDIINGSI